MSKRRPNPKRAKVNLPYTVDEVRKLFGVHPHTVRDWIKAGLPVVDGRKPYLVRGRDLRAFLEHRQAKRKQPCPPGHLYCFACHRPRKPADAMVDFEVREGRAGQLKAQCEACSTVMHRAANREQLPTILPGVAVRIVGAEPSIAEPSHPSFNPHFNGPDDHAQTQS